MNLIIVSNFVFSQVAPNGYSVIGNEVRDIDGHLYPNPVENSVSVEVGTNYFLCDKFERVVKTGVYAAEGITVDDLDSGFYILKIADRKFSFKKH